jgi:hypothetical protein
LKLSDTQKTYYWIFLLLVFTIFNFVWIKPFLEGLTTERDTTLLLIWVVILFFPLVSEIDFLGFSFKKEMDAFKTEISGKMLDLRSQIQNSISVITRNTQEVNVYYGRPSPPKKLEKLDETFRLISGQATFTPSTTITGSRTLKPSSTTIPPDYEVDAERKSLFEFRYALEQHISDIWERNFDADKKPKNIMQILRILFNIDIIGPIYFQMYKESYAICTSAIHGADYTPKQYDFVKNNVIKLIENFEDIAKY